MGEMYASAYFKIMSYDCQLKSLMFAKTMHLFIFLLGSIYFFPYDVVFFSIYIHECADLGWGLGGGGSVAGVCTFLHALSIELNASSRLIRSKLNSFTPPATSIRMYVMNRDGTEA
jgi:hypothetical protein